MVIQSLHQQNAVLRQLEKMPLELACDWLLRIECPIEGINTSLLVTDLRLPDLAPKVNSVNHNGVIHSFLSPTDNNSFSFSFVSQVGIKSPILSLYESQFVMGYPKFIKVKDRPTFIIYKVVPKYGVDSEKDNYEQVMVMSGCTVGYPVPTFGQDGATVYSCTVTFDNYQI